MIKHLYEYGKGWENTTVAHVKQLEIQPIKDLRERIRAERKKIEATIKSEKSSAKEVAKHFERLATRAEEKEEKEKEEKEKAAEENEAQDKPPEDAVQTPPGDSPDKKEAEKSGGDSNKVGNKPSKIDNEKIPGDSPATHDTPVGESQEETPEGDSSPPSDYSDVAASPGWYRGEAERQAEKFKIRLERLEIMLELKRAREVEVKENPGDPELLNTKKNGYLPIYYAVEGNAPQDVIDYIFAQMIEKYKHPKSIRTDLIFCGAKKYWKVRTVGDVKARIKKDKKFLFKENEKGELPIVHLVRKHCKLGIVKWAYEQNLKSIKWVHKDTGDSLLHVAATANSFKLVAFLMFEWPFAATLKNNDGEIPYDIAKRLQAIESRDILWCIRGPPKFLQPQAAAAGPSKPGTPATPGTPGSGGGRGRRKQRKQTWDRIYEDQAILNGEDLVMHPNK